MQGDAAYTVFFAFGIIWIVMGVAAFIGLLRLDKQQSGNQQTQFDGSGILVALPIILGIVVALAIAAKIS